ncbi:hypothetical protein KCU98_g23142, partial [Aureobasidium melanogenum]
MSHIPRYEPRAQKVDSPPAPVDDDTYFPMDEGLFPPPEDNDVPMSDPLPSSPVAKAAQRKGSNVKIEEDEDEDMLEVAQVTNQSSRSTAAINMRGNRPIPKITKTDYPTPASSSPSRQVPEAIDTSALTNVTDKLNVLSSSGVETVTFGKLDPQHAQEEDGSVRFFWFDYTDINGGLCLFGKVKDKSTGR